MSAGAWGKMLQFGLIGAMGCLFAAVVGEGLLSAARQTVTTSRAITPTLVSRPVPPDDVVAGKANRPDAPPPPKQAEPPPPPPGFEERRLRAGGRTGDVHIMLKWENYNDLDLHCIDPLGHHIFFNRKKSPTGGWLDVDKNARGREDNRPIENIFWPEGSAPFGTYRVFVNYYAQHDNVGPTNFEVTMRYGDQRGDFKGRLTVVKENSIEKSFVLKPVLRLAVAPVIDIPPGGENRLPFVLSRGFFTSPVTVALQGNPPGVESTSVTLNHPQTSGELPLRILPGAVNGSRSLHLLAHTDAGGGVSVVMPFTLNITQGTLQLAVPERLEVARNGENWLPLALTSTGLMHPIKLEVTGDLTDLSSEAVTVQPGTTEADLLLRAGQATPGTRPLSVMASAEGVTPVKRDFQLTVLEPAASSWSWLKIPLMAAWTGLLATGLGLALAIGQNRSLQRPWLSLREAALLLVGGMLAGGLAGSLAEVLQHPSLGGGSTLASLGFLAGWTLLGGLVGWGVGWFIPNLDRTKATFAGALGGVLGGGAFLGASALRAEMAGRWAGAVLLGFCIGLMVALVEAAFRRAWLEIEYRPKEIGTVNLGPEPIGVGGHRRWCKVLIPGAPEVAYRYSFLDGRVFCEDVLSKRTEPVPPGHQRTVLGAKVTVRMASDTGPPITVPSPPRLDKVSVTLSPTTKATLPQGHSKPSPSKQDDDRCPICGRKASGLPGKRYCMIDDLTF